MRTSQQSASGEDLINLANADLDVGNAERRKIISSKAWRCKSGWMANRIPTW